MICPIDKTEMKNLNRGGVLIDVCPVCMGVWLGRGELEKIIEHSIKEHAAGTKPPGIGGENPEVKKTPYLAALFDLDDTEPK
jgi:Zn-finger nucleic acid-binding protein